MIRINDITKGRFGNRILQYNSMAQMANSLGVKSSCVLWEGHDFFSDLSKPTNSNNNETLITWKDLLDYAPNSYEVHSNTDYAIGPYCIHNTFYKLTKTDPRNFLKIKENFKRKLTDGFLHVGIHIRGTDFITADDGWWNVGGSKFYKDSINMLESELGKDIFFSCMHR